jgi:hypothetical protein
MNLIGVEFGTSQIFSPVCGAEIIQTVAADPTGLRVSTASLDRAAVGEPSNTAATSPANRKDVLLIGPHTR